MSLPASFTDLTVRPPRSPHVRLGGYVSLPRIIDKARAAVAGKLGEYYYGPEGLNGHFFRFVGIDPESFKAEVARGGGDWDILEWIQANAKNKREPWEIAAWSDYHTRRAVDSDTETLEKFAKQMGAVNPMREDVKTRFDFLDLDDHCTFGGKA